MDTLLLIWIVCALISAFIAQSKGQNPVTWLALGGMFGVFALLALLFVRPEDDA